MECDLVSAAPVLLGAGWGHDLQNLARSASTRLFVSSPYVTAEGVTQLVANLQPSLAKRGTATLLTNLANSVTGSTDPGAVLTLAGELPRLSIRHLPSVHAKVYISDSAAIVTSGNLTRGGLFENVEYGVWIDDAPVVSRAWDDLLGLAAQGSEITVGSLQRLAQLVAPLRRQPRPRLPPKVADELERILIGPRLHRGTVHGTFAETIAYLLRRDGPATMHALHEKVRSIHPDLCDDNIDRVIDGRRYGKKWKHAVRSSMQGLKRRGLVEHDGTSWRGVL